MFSVALFLLLSPLSASALLLPLPRATRSVDYVPDLKGISPRPTPPPAFPKDHLRWKRAESDSFLGWLAPDNTCGYVRGEFATYLSCVTGEVCGVVPGSDANNAVCLDIAEATLRGLGNCLDYTESLSACRSGCTSSSITRTCSNSDYPYCHPYSIADLNAILFDCDSTSVTTFVEVVTTFDGQVDGATWEELYDTLSTTPTTITSTITSTTTSTSISTSPSDTPTQPSGPGGGSSPNTGAIAGGVVGGAAVLALVGFGIFLLRRRGKSDNQPPSEAQPQPIFIGGQDPKGPQQSMSYVQQPQPPPPPQAYYPYQPMQPLPGPDGQGPEAVGYIDPHTGSNKDSYPTSPASPITTLPRYSVAGETPTSSGPASPNLGSQTRLDPMQQGQQVQQVQQIQQGQQVHQMQQGQQPPSHLTEMWAGTAPR